MSVARALPPDDGPARPSWAGPRSVLSLSPAIREEPAGAPAPVPTGAPALRVQMLATEHWSLLGTRSQLWSEVMGRITAQFTFGSASLVVLALTQQALGVAGAFHLLAVWLGVSVLLTGTLTALRVRNANQEDLMLLAGMNRLRAAYVAMDPSVRDHLVTGWTDDPAGIRRTYAMGVRRSGMSHTMASAYVFASTVNVIVAAGLGAILADSSGAGETPIVLAGIAAALTYAAVVVLPAYRGYTRLLGHWAT